MGRSILFVVFLFVLFLSVRVLKASDVSSQTQSVQYSGVEHLLPLSNKWIIVITNNSDEVVQKIDEITNGDYLRHVNTWKESLKKGQPNWQVKRNYLDKMLGDHFGEARELAGERQLDNPDFFSITSPNDSNYQDPKHPIRTTRFIPSLGEGKITKRQVPGNIDIHYAHYNYLELPHPLKNGDTYTVTLGNGKKVTFLYDELKTISRAIKINQVGYLPQAPKKYAYLASYLHEFGPQDFSQADTFYVINSKTGDVAFEGKITLRAENPRFEVDKGGQDPKSRPLISGEDIYELDFTDLKEEGEFFISIPTVGRSWTFKHTPDVYGEPFYIAARSLYHQRSGMAIDSKYSAWSRKAYHTGPVYESMQLPLSVPISTPKNYDRFDVVGKTFSKETKTDDATGGWYDAADWDRNLQHYVAVFDLMYAYELNQDNFYAGQLNIPESDNPIPDILDEAEYGILVWKKSMREDGGVSGAVETWTHPSRDDPNALYAYSLRTRWASLLYAGAAAQYAYLVKPFDAKKAEEYTESALKAYAYGIDPNNSLGKIEIPAAKNRGKGENYTVTFEEKENENAPFRIHAATRLYMLTGNENYLDGIAEMLSKAFKPYDWPFSYKDYSPWMYYSLVFGPPSDKIPQFLKNQWREKYITHANNLVGMISAQPYRISWPAKQDYWMAWGASVMTNPARPLLIAYHVTSDTKYLNAALQNLDFVLGANPMGMSWMTGLGHTYPIEIQHENSEVDGMIDPIPGILIYGITGGDYPQEYKRLLWEPNGKTFMTKANWSLPVWRKWASHPHTNVPQNEFTVSETLSSAIFSYAMLLPNGWMPSQELKEKTPRPKELLHGYWILP